MKHSKIYITLLFCIVTIVNLFIFFYRDKFAYHKYGTYASVYSSGIAKWKRLTDDYSKQELAEARKILGSSINSQGQTTSFKILEIGKFLYNIFYKQIGVASVRLYKLSPLEQYKLLSSSDSIKLWCGNFADMFAFFCASEGISCRVIEIMNPGDHHVVNECYLPEENKWVMTDVTNDQLLLLNKNKNRYENLLNLRDSLVDPILSLQASGSSIKSNPFKPGFYDKYFGNKNPVNYYHSINFDEIYKTSEKIKRYFLPVTWYEEITETPRRNVLFYLKQISILLWLITVVLVVKKAVKPQAQTNFTR